MSELWYRAREHAEAARELLEKLVPLPEDQEVMEQT